MPCFLIAIRPPPRTTLFPYTTLFRSVGKPQVAYREAITRSAQAHGRFVRQSGGKGQFGDVKIRLEPITEDRKSTRLNSSHSQISYAVFCLKKKKLRARLSNRTSIWHG